ncbi:MAG: GGDEF domain-containing protein [Aquabacterium sp.]
MAVPRSIRLHRDNPTLRDAGQPPHDARSSTPEAVLARGHVRLRFPAELEAAFQADALDPRLRLLFPCGFLGVLGVLVGTSNVGQLTPEIAGLVWQLVWLWVLGTAGLLLGVRYLLPRRWRRPWQGEALTAVMATAMSLLITWMATASRADTAFTHSVTAAMPVMYSCIAARLRFYWALPGALLSFFCYALFVTGFTPEQALLASGTLKLMGVSVVFSLAANYVFEYRERRTWLLRKVEAQQRGELIATSAHLEKLSIQDPLTGLANRRQFDKAMAQACAQAASKRRPLALLFVDVDDFKLYNDRHGHPAGDDCLAQVARVIGQVAASRGGSAARLGGEEFSILLPDHTLGQAEAVGLALCEAVAAARIAHGASSVSPVVTVSVGAAQAWPGQDPSGTALMQQADAALYQAKQGGRNRVSTDAGQPMGAGSHMACVTQQAVDAAPVELDEAARATDGLLARTLEGRFLSLRFPSALERLYRRGRSNQRRKQLAVASVVGLIIYNGFVFANKAMFPDIGEDVLLVQLWLSIFMMILTITCFLMRMPLAWRESLYCLGTSVVAFISTWVLAHSQQTSALSFAVSLALIPMFSGVGARQPFWFTCATALITCVGAAWLLTPHDALQRLVYIDSLFVIVNLTVYSLILAYTLEHSQRKEWLLAQLDARQRQALEAATQRLQQLSAVDPLTGICNRRQFEHDLNRIWQESLLDERPVAMLIVDVDHFKPYNDGYGHPQGDACLQQVADILTRAAHAGKGLAARMGGEEFGILLPGANVDAAVALGERLCEAVRAAHIAHSYSGAGIVTISVGVASIRPDAGVDRISLFATADKALYEAKRMGRDRVVAPSTAGFRA